VRIRRIRVIRVPFARLIAILKNAPPYIRLKSRILEAAIGFVFHYFHSALGLSLKQMQMN
jgi:hypothetical protein